MARIAIWRLNPYIGGTEVSLLELARFLKSIGHEVFVYGHRDRAGNIADAFGVPIWPEAAFLGRSHDILLWYDCFYRFQRENDPVFLPAMLKIPHRYSIFGGFVDSLGAPFIRKAIAKSEEISDWLKATMGIKDVKVAQFPIALDYWKREKEQNNEQPIVGYVGRTEQKNIGQLVRIAKNAGGNKVRLVVSDVIKTEDIDSMGAEVVRNQPLMKPWYEGFDVFMMTSLREGLPRTIMEAMAMRLPVIVWNIGGIATLKPTHMFQANDEASAVSALKLLVENKEVRTEVGMLNRHAIEEYDARVRADLTDWFGRIR